MPRRGFIARRELQPDPLYNSALVTKFISCLTYDGKKSVGEQIFYGAMEIVQDRTKEDPLKIFRKAVDSCLKAFSGIGTWPNLSFNISLHEIMSSEFAAEARQVRYPAQIALELVESHFVSGDGKFTIDAIVQ